MDHIAWDDVPPRVPQAHVWTPPPGRHHLILLGSHRGVWTHWMGRRSLPCLDKECPSPRHKKPINWVGYYAAVILDRVEDAPGMWKPGRRIVLPVNLAAANGLTAYQSLARVGVTILKKEGRKDWVLESTRQTPGQRELPADFPVEDVLMRLWGIRPPRAVMPQRSCQPDAQDYDSEESYLEALREWLDANNGDVPL